MFVILKFRNIGRSILHFQIFYPTYEFSIPPTNLNEYITIWKII